MRTLSLTSPVLLLAFVLLEAPLAFAQAGADAPSTPPSGDAAPNAEEGNPPPSDAEGEEPAEPTPPDATDSSESAPPVDAPADNGSEEAAAGEEAPDRAAPQGKGVIWGKVVDSGSGEPLIEAQVKVEGRKAYVLTDYDGYFRLELPPGAYTLRFFYELHDPLRLEGVRVTEGKLERVDAQIVPSSDAVDEVVVEERAERATLEGQILARQQSATVQDGVGRAEIKKTTDSTAAEAAQRVVGATIVDGQFVYVRGLGERYTNSLLNGIPLPSTDPNRAAVPLDLFPTQVIDSINIAKTFTPDMPADFAGGSVQIQTRGIPQKFLFAVSLKGGFNDQTTFQKRLDHRGGSLDFLGIDDGTRRMPDSVPTDYPAQVGNQKPDGSLVTPEEITRIGRDVNSYMSATESTSPPNYGFSAVVGNGFELDATTGRRWGYLASISYDRSYTRIPDGIQREFSNNIQPDGSFLREMDYEFQAGKDEVRWGLYGGLMYDATRRDKFRLSLLHSQDGEDATVAYEGFDNSRQTNVNNTRLAFVSRGMTLAQFQGEHELEQLSRAVLDYNLFIANANRYEPDTRDTVYNYFEGINGYGYGDGPQAGRHFWSDQDEQSYGGGVNYTQPLNAQDAKFKIGGLASLKHREFEARRLSFVPNADAGFLLCESGSSFPQDCPDDHFLAKNIGSRAEGSLLELQENTRNTDAYESQLNVYAGYMMVDTKAGPRTRIIFGPRVEVTNQSVTPVEQLGVKPDMEPSELDDVSLLPGAAVVFDVTENSKLRVSASRTLARPQVRELAPFSYSDYFGGREVTGNPDLEMTKILNGDVRFEYFPSLREVLAVSLFGKHFKDPIEPVLKPAGNSPELRPENAEGAVLFGVELEARKNLGFLSGALHPFSFVSNLTLSRSRIDVDDKSTVEGVTYLTNPSRPMANQSPAVFNAALDWDFETGTKGRLLYNVSARRLVEVGTQGLPDAYEQARHALDFTLGQKVAKQWEIKFSAENILNSPVVITQGEDEADDESNVQLKYTTGRIFGITAEYEM